MNHIPSMLFVPMNFLVGLRKKLHLPTSLPCIPGFHTLSPNKDAARISQVANHGPPERRLFMGAGLMGTGVQCGVDIGHSIGEGAPEQRTQEEGLEPYLSPPHKVIGGFGCVQSTES